MRTKRELIPTFQSTSPSSSSSDPPSNLSSDTVFWFLDENYPSSGNISDATSEHSVGGTIDSLFENGEDELDGEGNPVINQEERTRAFWEEQEQLLLSTLRRTTPTESKIRQVTKEALREYNSNSLSNLVTSSSSSSSSSDPSNSPCCRQASPIIKGIISTSSSRCNSCLRREMVCQRLRDAGHNSFIRKSIWKSSSEIPSGDHTYLEVEVNNKPVMKVIIETNFRAEFEMERAGKEYYKRLVSHLPEVFVGKPERLKTLVKILCGAAKKCIKEKGMHLGPWRKHKYMQSKWMLTTTTTTTFTSCDVPMMMMGSSNRPAVKLKSSMLTLALQLDHSNNLHPRQAAAVV